MKRLLFLCALLAGCGGVVPIPVPVQAQPEAPPPATPKVGDAKTRAKVHTDLGTVYYQGGKMGVAIEEARVALAADANYAPAYNLLGLVYMNLQEHADARTNFERAVALAPNDGEFNNNYGWFLCTQGRERDGIRYLMTAVKNPLYTTPTRPYTNAGLCALRLKDDTLAEDYLKKAVIADGGNSQALYLLADVSYRKDKLTEARRLINQVHRQIEPTAESVWLALRIERKLGDRDAMASYATRLNRDFAGSKEQRALAQGQFD